MRCNADLERGSIAALCTIPEANGLQFACNLGGGNVSGHNGPRDFKDTALRRRESTPEFGVKSFQQILESQGRYHQK